MNLSLMEKGVELVLKGMGIPLADPNFRGTPRRVARMYKELLTPPSGTWASFPSSATDLVMLRGHRVVALCPHHLMPVELTCYVGYIPHKRTVGLSKLARVIEAQLNYPILQEELAHSVANSLNDELDPKGVGVVLAGIHGCMRYRGVQTSGDVVVSAMKGVLLLDPTSRSEFLRLIGRP